MKVLATYFMYTKSRVKICWVYVNICLFTLPLIKIMNYVVVLYKQCACINYQREMIMNSVCEMYRKVIFQ